MVKFFKKTIALVLTVLFTLLEICISWIFSAVILPPAIILVLGNEIVRLFVACCLKIKFGSSVKLGQHGTDNVWSFKKPGSSPISLSLVFYKNQLEVEKYRELFNDRVINYQTESGSKPYEKFRYIFTKHFGYVCMKKDKNFNIKNHVRYYPGSETKIVTENELLEEILPELYLDMGDSSPQWEEVIIPKFQYNVNDKEATKLAGEGGTVSVSILRYNHGFMDGATNALMWAYCMSEGKKFPIPVNPIAPLKIPLWKSMVYNLSCILLGATTIIRSLYVSAAINNRFVAKNLTGKRFFAWTSPIDINQLNEIRAKTKYSLPTILAAVIGGAFRKLDQKYPSNKEEFRNFPNEIILGLVAAILPYPNFHPRNRFAIVNYHANTSEMSYVERLQLASTEMEKLGRSPVAYLNFIVLNIVGRFPFFIIESVYRDLILPIVFSNVPLTKRNVKYWDNEVVDCLGWPPILVNAISILSIRYSGHVRVCGHTDEACLSAAELNFFLTEVENEVKLMLEECSDQR